MNANSDAEQAPLRLVSYNIRKCLGLDMRRRPERTLEVISETFADIIVLQEADRRMAPRPTALPRKLIEIETDYEPLELGSEISLGWHGNAILLRKGVEGRVVDRLILPGLEPRGAVIAEVGGLRLVGAHLGLRRRDRRLQLAYIQAALERLDPMPTAMLGDFNEWSPDIGLEPLLGHFAVHSPGKSFHAAHPVAALDRIALGSGVELRDAGVAQGRKAAMASDHLPIWARIRAASPSDA